LNELIEVKENQWSAVIDAEISKIEKSGEETNIEKLIQFKKEKPQDIPNFAKKLFS